MRSVRVIAFGLLMWPAAEVVVFIIVATLVGFTAALGLLILTSMYGFLVLRRAGAASFSRLRSAAGHTGHTVAIDVADMAAGLGGILLVIPGFITSALGVAVIVPASRRWLMATVRHVWSPSGRPREPGVVELAPDEWQPLPEPGLPTRRQRRGS